MPGMKPSRTDFPMGNVGRGQWLRAVKTWEKSYGTHKEQRSEKGKTAADETVNVGSGAKKEALKQRQGERKEDYNARVERAKRPRAPAAPPAPPSAGITTKDAAEALRKR